MADIIQLADHRRDRETPPVWLFDLSASKRGDMFEATIMSFNEMDGLGSADRLRHYADCLDQLSWFMRQQAEHLEATADGMPLAAALVFESSKVRVRVNDDKVTTAEQFEWLDRCFDDAKEAARPSPLPEG